MLHLTFSFVRERPSFNFCSVYRHSPLAVLYDPEYMGTQKLLEGILSQQAVERLRRGREGRPDTRWEKIAL
jgi:hypothetical protein